MSLPPDRPPSHSTTLRRKRRSIPSPATIDRLEPRQLMADGTSVFISEFLASNTGGIEDRDGDRSDWIELYNPTDAAVSLANYALTDDRADLARWKFPTGVSIPAGGYLVVFASGKDLRVAGQELHTNFTLDPAGEDLLLVGPAGTQADVRSAYTPYPEQLPDVSYGVGVTENLSTLVGPRATTRARVPTADIGTSWRGITYDDSTWASGTTGVGYDVPFSGGLVPGFTLRQVDVTGGNVDTAINSLQEAIDILDGKNLSNYNFNFNGAANVPLINHGAGGSFGGDRPLPSGFGPTWPSSSDERSNYAMRATANLVIPAGQWTVNVNSDDGFRLTIPGVTFLGRFNENTAGMPTPSPADTLVWGPGRGAANTFATFTVPDGGLSTTLRLDYYDGTGGDTVELSVASGHQSAFAIPPFTLLSDGVNGWSVKTTGGAGDLDMQPLIGTDVRSAMRGNNATAYVRVPFNVDEQEGFDRLRLRMKYDDGFVAYVNGVEVARRNAPGTVAWNSAATTTRPDESALQFQDFSFTLPNGTLRDGDNVLAIHGLNDARDGNDFLVLPELKGIVLEFDDGRYFRTPTPRAENPSSSLTDFVEDTKFSHNRGFYDAPFFVTITTDTPAAQIRYTTDGTAPTATTGTAYSGPVRVGTTTVLRAAAFKPGFVPSNVDTQTYIFLNDVINQPENPNGFPAVGSPGVHWDYGMDPQVVDNPAYASTIINDLKSIPSLSLVLAPDDLFGGRGIYTNPTGDGVFWERPGSAELILPDGTRGFQIDAGVRIQGGASRNTTHPKHSFRLLFKSQYGADKLRYPLFDDTPGGQDATDEFDTIILRAGYNKSWAHSASGQRAMTQYLQNQFMADAHRDMGHKAIHGTFVHLYVNGQYWGLYNPVERPSAPFMESYFGGEEEQWDVLNSNLVISGTRDSWTALHNLANGVVPGGPWTPEVPNPNAMASSAAYEQIKQLLDVENFVDYMVGNFYGANLDWDHHNWYAAKKRDATGRWRFFMWDSERTLESPSNDVTELNFMNNPSRLWQQLRVNPEFRLLVADRVHKHMFNDGTLTPAASIARYNALLAEIDRAVVGESARWGDFRRPDQPYTRDVEWVAERNRLLNSYFPGRTATVINQFLADGLYPTTGAPRFNQHGGVIGSNFELQITNPNTGGGTVYYTLDGTDPRLPGGGVAPGALVYGGPVGISQTTDVTARVLLNGVWSAANAARFTFDLGAIRITEVMYNPAPPAPGGTTTATDYEFIEVENTASRRVLLAGIQLREGIEFTFGNFSLDPGQRAVVVRNPTAFRARYGDAPIVAGTYTNSLSDGGERIVLRGPLGQSIVDFTYDDDWYAQTDGGGYSLVAVNPNASNTVLSQKPGWRPSNRLHGGPGAADPGTAPGAVMINEVLTAGGTQGDFVELHNTTGAEVNISGWFISNTDTNLRRFRVPDNTFVPANEFLVFDEAALGFGLAESGGTVYLSSVDPSGNVGGYRETARFAGALPGAPFGEYVKSTGGTDFVSLVSPTPGAANSAPLVGPVVISEVMYNPELSGSSEFIELRNLTGSDVPLYDPADPTRRWKFVDGIDYTLPENAVIPAFGYVIVSQVAPDTFRQLYSVPAGVSVYGPYSVDGTTNLLDNGGENLTLYRPGPGTSFVLADRLNYDDVAPWPATPDGGGPSLARRDYFAYGNDVANWAADIEGGTPGRHNNDRTAPTADVTDVVPDPRGEAVDSVTIVFDEPVTGLDVADLVLAVNGGTNILTGAETLTTDDNVTWTLSGLAALTAGPGTYVLTVVAAGSGVVDYASNELAADASDTWRFVRGTTVAGRHVFYNNSAFDGRSVAANAQDDGAVATDKAALLPGEPATGANYTSYSRGINGVMIDIAGLASDLSAADFTFRAGPGGDPTTWELVAAPVTVTRRPGAGTGGSDRVTLVWADGAILNAWLQVSMKANANTGLAAPDVFYFGNIAGDTGNAPPPGPAGGPSSGDVAFVSVTDLVAMRNAVRPGAGGVAPITSRFDHNRDGRVNLLDMAVTRRGMSNRLQAIAEPLPPVQEAVLSGSFQLGSTSPFSSPTPPLAVESRPAAYQEALLLERDEE